MQDTKKKIDLSHLGAKYIGYEKDGKFVLAVYDAHGRHIGHVEDGRFTPTDLTDEK